MKRLLLILLLAFTSLIISSCAMAGVSRDRTLYLSGKTVSEADEGGVVRWYAVDKYNSQGDGNVRFQVGYFKNTNRGFILYEGGTRGELAYFYRKGLNLRWDWENYAIVIKPDGTGLYYDFSYQSNGVKPSGFFEMHKF